MSVSGVELIVTYKCDWDCDYCLIDTHNQPERKYKNVLAEAKDIAPGTEVTFSGGETGLMPRRQLVELINLLEAKNCPLDLLTNGLFIRKHAELLPHFQEVFYHCVEYIGQDIEFPNLDQDKFLYILVVIDRDFVDDRIMDMVRKYPHIKFLVLPDIRRSHKINLNTFMKFLNAHEQHLHPRTRSEFVSDLSRTWGARGHELNPFGPIVARHTDGNPS